MNSAVELSFPQTSSMRLAELKWLTVALAALIFQRAAGPAGAALSALLENLASVIDAEPESDPVNFEVARS